MDEEVDILTLYNYITVGICPGTEVIIPVGHDMINSEGVGIWEPIGFSQFAWLPKRCRNGRSRWFTWVQKHADGTFTKCNLG